MHFSRPDDGNIAYSAYDSYPFGELASIIVIINLAGIIFDFFKISPEW